MKKMKIYYFIAIIITAIFVGFLLGHYFKNTKESGSSQVTTKDKKPLYWIDPMEPTIHYQAPGKSRMNMELKPVYADDAKNVDQSAVRISPNVENNLGIRTALVTQGALSRRIETVATVEPDENKISHIHTYADGWVKKLFVHAVGDSVKAQQVILQLYSPSLINVQEEYLIALGTKDLDLMNASYKRLQAFHISEQQIQRIKKTRKASQLVDIYSHQNGVVTMLNVREGMRVTPDTEMMSIVDLSHIWIIAQVYENQADWIKVGESAEATLSAFPGKVWKGRVEYIYPQVDPTTRSLKVRLQFDNPNDLLKPNMYANIILLSEPKQNAITIPLEALIRGKEENHVIVALGDGRFESRTVIIGMESGNKIEILSGLTVGEKVVTSGQFLIDSEANLKSSMQRLETPVENAKSSIQAASKNNASIESTGVITELNISENTITIKHAAIPELNWPEMTMSFQISNKIALTDFKAGDHIQFTITKSNEDFVVMDIKKLAN